MAQSMAALGHDPDPATDTCRLCGATRMAIEDGLTPAGCCGTPEARAAADARLMKVRYLLQRERGGAADGRPPIPDAGVFVPWGEGLRAKAAAPRPMARLVSISPAVAERLAGIGPAHGATTTSEAISAVLDLLDARDAQLKAATAATAGQLEARARIITALEDENAQMRADLARLPDAAPKPGPTPEQQRAAALARAMRLR